MGEFKTDVKYSICVYGRNAPHMDINSGWGIIQHGQNSKGNWISTNAVFTQHIWSSHTVQAS